ncbi:hypothetical protein FVE85_2410 [Porphyridium purpureum]|uniref:Uncharacterized protein n=1 Tax=Porphyridium purpureum TaxID=35688 RepID=A0A5J4YYQ7_PORPP|nr:hypothetical protein FVE85_2410 [Porphyridium purpureum]|eukprot:POR9272..scf209_3
MWNTLWLSFAFFLMTHYVRAQCGSKCQTHLDESSECSIEYAGARTETYACILGANTIYDDLKAQEDELRQLVVNSNKILMDTWNALSAELPEVLDGVYLNEIARSAGARRELLDNSGRAQKPDEALARLGRFSAPTAVIAVNQPGSRQTSRYGVPEPEISDSSTRRTLNDLIPELNASMELLVGPSATLASLVKDTIFVNWLINYMANLDVDVDSSAPVRDRLWYQIIRGWNITQHLVTLTNSSADALDAELAELASLLGESEPVAFLKQKKQVLMEEQATAHTALIIGCSMIAIFGTFLVALLVGIVFKSRQDGSQESHDGERAIDADVDIFMLADEARTISAMRRSVSDGELRSSAGAQSWHLDRDLYGRRVCTVFSHNQANDCSVPEAAMAILHVDCS